MTMQNQLINLLNAYTPVDAREQRHHELIQAFVGHNENCASESNQASHVTASAWILNPAQDAVLLTHHRKLERWLQLGGHVENDFMIQDAAMREAREESGIWDLALLDDALFDVDAHIIPAKNEVPEHYHYDLRFLFQSATEDFKVSQESLNLSWVKLADMLELSADASLQRMTKKTLVFLGLERKNTLASTASSCRPG